MSRNTMNRRSFLAGSGALVVAGAWGPKVAGATRAASHTYLAPSLIGQAQVELLWATPGNPDEVAVYNEVAKTFMEANPDIKVTTDREAADYDKFVSLLAAGTPPDVGFSTINTWAAYADRKVFAPLDDFIKQDSYDIEDFYPQIIDVYKYDGDSFGKGPLYGLPKEIAVRAMYYNKDIFSEAGIETPTADKPWTWDQFTEMAKATTKVEGGRTRQYGYILSPGWLYWNIWTLSAGALPVDDLFKPTKSNLDDPKILEGYQYFTDYVTQLKVAPDSAATKDQGTAEMFAAGLGATYNNGRWMVPLFRTSKFEWDVMPMPMKEQRAQTLSGSMFGVTAASKNPDAAWKLLSYIVSKDGQAKMTDLGLLLPSRKSVAESDTFLKSTPPETNQIFIDELEFAKPLPMTPKYPEIEKVVDDQTELVITGDTTAKDALAEMHKQMNAMLQS